MNINAAIIDQMVSALRDQIADRARGELNIASEDKLTSLAFVHLCVKTILDLGDDDAFECLTEGGQDFGVDALHISEEYDGEFTVSIFQAKYSRKLEGLSNFGENGIKAIINATRYLFDPKAEINNINQRLKSKTEEIKSLIRDGYIPQVRALACNNGLPWNESAQEEITRAGFGSQVTWEHVNHDRLVSIFQSTKPVDDSLQFSGKAIIEDFNFSRVMVARIAATEIAALIKRHGERLLERNVRRYLGLQGNRVNEAIRDTLKGNDQGNFYFFNNGITLTCDRFDYNALQGLDYKVNVKNLQIINGGQTCMTIFKTLEQAEAEVSPTDAYVLVRLYQLPSDNDELVRTITFATNSQNPVDLKDLRANDDKQKRLELDIAQLGYNYKRKRTDSPTKPTEITSGVAAEAILSVWLKRPHQAKFFSREHFGKLYPIIFSDTLNGAQVILAALLYRIAENKRKRPPLQAPPFLPYASCFIAMQMGKYLLAEMNCSVSGLSHSNFSFAREIIDSKEDEFFYRAVDDIDGALKELYGGATQLSLQQLSATFRRGDLIEKLAGITSSS